MTFFQDSQLLYQKFSKPLGLVRVNFEKFNHVDFIWAKDVNKLLNDELIEFVKNGTSFFSGSQFIEDNVDRAIVIRNNTVAPVDVPFDNMQFIMNYPTSGPFSLPAGISPQDFAKYPKQIHDQVLRNVNKINTGE